MLTIEDCIAMIDLTEAEIDAIAEHEQIPEIVAAELGAYLLTKPDGETRIAQMIADDIQTALSHLNHERAAVLKLVLKHFLECHTGAETPR